MEAEGVSPTNVGGTHPESVAATAPVESVEAVGTVVAEVVPVAVESEAPSPAEAEVVSAPVPVPTVPTETAVPQAEPLSEVAAVVEREVVAEVPVAEAADVVMTPSAPSAPTDTKVEGEGEAVVPTETEAEVVESDAVSVPAGVDAEMSVGEDEKGGEVVPAQTGSNTPLGPAGAVKVEGTQSVKGGKGAASPARSSKGRASPKAPKKGYKYTNPNKIRTGGMDIDASQLRAGTVTQRDLDPKFLDQTLSISLSLSLPLHP
ncbi:hypothetical protein KIPB_010502 [Kipferlia bialata]|uniref:Uncharacterized protein n=1 Tax=Kipferlia bialata TaxID=797122 RepID=A0A9K3GML0_9EUKA|nr:hypothetical protein KIPB_010502 [Kipferlia bialata]|eukprot:g10502.t1